MLAPPRHQGQVAICGGGRRQTSLRRIAPPTWKHGSRIANSPRHKLKAPKGQCLQGCAAGTPGTVRSGISSLFVSSVQLLASPPPRGKSTITTGIVAPPELSLLALSAAFAQAPPSATRVIATSTLSANTPPVEGDNAGLLQLVRQLEHLPDTRRWLRQHPLRGSLGHLGRWEPKYTWRNPLRLAPPRAPPPPRYPTHLGSRTRPTFSSNEDGSRPHAEGWYTCRSTVAKSIYIGATPRDPCSGIPYLAVSLRTIVSPGEGLRTRPGGMRDERPPHECDPPAPPDRFFHTDMPQTQLGSGRRE